MTLATARAGLATAVSTIVDCSTYKRDQINPPCADVTPGEWDPRFVMGEGRTARPLIVTVYAGRTDEAEAQEALDSYVEMTGDTSLIAAIQDEDNAMNNGTTADYAVVTDVSELLVVTIGAIDYIAIRLTVEVCF